MDGSETGASLQDTAGAPQEIWQCQDGPVRVAVDSDGCPLESTYCKIQAGGVALAVLTLATFTITITITNLVFARVRGLVMAASSPVAAPILDTLDQVGITSIDVLGNQMISGEVPASRYAKDVTGPGGVGTQQLYRGDVGTAGGVITIAGINRSLVTLNIWAAVDISGKKGG